MELTEASLLRSTSVSSRRRIIVPPVLRAYNQLKINVRALPTWRNPVGEGAKRTRGLPCSGDVEGLDISRIRILWELRCYGPLPASSTRHACNNYDDTDFGNKPLFARAIEGGHFT